MIGTRRSLPLLVLVVAGCGDGRNPSILNPEGPKAEEASFLFWLMLALGTPVLALVVGIVLSAAARSRRSPNQSPGADSTTGTSGERRSIAWIVAGGIVLPVVVVVPLSVLTLFSLNRTEALPAEDALVVEVEGHRFWWEVRYPGTDAVTANEIHIPAGRDVRFVLTTADVIHSFWAPNLGGKRDMIPGEVTDLVYRAEEPGVYEGACAEFCGVQHAWMRLLVIAHPPEAFDEWLAHQASDAAPATTEAEVAGLAAFFELGCASCHAVRGTDAEARIGPDLTHVAERQTLASVTVTNNLGNLGGWISNPHGIKPGTTMPATPMTGAQLNALLAYLSSLR